MKQLLRALILLLLGLCLLPAQSRYLSAASFDSSPTPTAFATADNNPSDLAPITPENAQQIKSIKRFGQGMVKQVMWSPDNKLLGICSSAGIWLYRTDNFDSEPRLLQNKAECRKLAFSPDSLLMASFGNIDDYKIQVWDLETGSLKIELRWQGGELDWIYSLAFSPDSSLLAFGGTSGVQIWNFKTQTQRSFSTFPYGTTGSALAFNQNGTLLAAAEAYGVDVWDVETGEKNEIRGPTAQDVRFSADGKFLVTTNGNNVRLWYVTGGPQRAVLLNNDHVYSAQFSADGKSVVTGNANSIIVWDAFRYVQLSKIQNPWSSVKNVALNPDNTLAAAIDDRDVRVFVWETKTGKLRAELNAFTREMRMVRFNSTGQKLVFSGNNGVWLWDVQSTHLVTLILDSHRNYGTAGFLDDGKKIYFSDSTPDSIIWDAQSGKEILTGEIGPYGDRKAVSPDGKTLAVGRPDASIVLVDLETGKLQKTLNGHKDMIRDLVFSQDGKLLASCANDSTLRIWDITTGQEQLNIVDSEHLFVADVIAFSPDSTHIVGALGNLGIKIWNVKTGELITTLWQIAVNPLNAGVADIIFNSDGRILAASGYDGVIYLWSTPTYSLLTKLIGHLDAIYGLDFSPDGKLLASASEDGTVRLWGIPQ
jgi:WD40 repeat protein